VSRAVALALALVLALPAIVGHAQTDATTSVVTPFYTAEFPAGGLVLRDAGSGVPLLQEGMPELCLGEPSIDPIELMPNGSFEALSTSGSPIGWDVYRPYINVSTSDATAGTNTLAWQLAAPDDPNGRGADSPSTPVTGGERYLVSFDWRGLKISGSEADVSLAWYPEKDGQGQRNVVFLRRMLGQDRAGSSRAAHESVQVVVPPQAQSIRLLFRAAPDLTGSLDLDRVSFKHLSCPRPDGPSATVTSARRDAATTEVVSELAWADARIRQTWQLSRVAPVIQMRAEITYGTPTYVTSERLQFVAPNADAARTLGRDLRPTPLLGSIGFSGDPLSPRLLDVPGKLLVRADGAQSTLAWGDGSNALLNVYADLDLNHPLGLYVRGQDGDKADVSQTYRKTGDTSSLDMQIVVGQHAQPVTLARQPNGFDATLAISEHADGANVDTSAAVNYGTSDEADPDYGRRGLVGNGIRYTKSVFAFPARGWTEDTLQTRRYAAQLRQLADAGVEIVPHTITGGTDDRSSVKAGLDLFAPFGARNWIDHGNGDGLNNLEALTSEGLLTSSQYRISDLLASYGYTYAWSDVDYPIEQDNINLLRPDQAWEPRALAFSLTRDDGSVATPPGFYFWSTAIPTLAPELFVTPANIERLVSERGVFVSHDYYPRARYEGHLFNTSAGVVSISPAFESGLEAIGNAQRAGRLWVPTVSELLDFWTALFKVRVVELGGGGYRVVNGGDRAIDALTMLVGADARTALIGGQPTTLDGQKLRLPRLAAHAELDVSLQ